MIAPIPDRNVLYRLTRILVTKLSLQVLRAVYDDSALITHVRITAQRVKLDTRFDGNTSIWLKSLLPKPFLTVIEFRIPESEAKFPMLSGTVRFKDIPYSWTLDPLTSTLIVRSMPHNGTFKITKTVLRPF